MALSFPTARFADKMKPPTSVPLIGAGAYLLKEGIEEPELNYVVTGGSLLALGVAGLASYLISRRERQNVFGEIIRNVEEGSEV